MKQLQIYALALALLAGVVYLPYLANPLVFDDFNIIKGNRFFDYAFQLWIAPRWLPYATLAHNYLLTDGSVIAMRLGNMALHVANVVAVFVILRALCLAVIPAGGAEKSRDSEAVAVGLLGAALFAVHPVAVYGVGYLVQRSILMSTLFMLLMLIAYLRWLTSGRIALWVWSAMWYLLSVISKEHSIMAPAVALLLTPLVQRPTVALGRQLIAPFLGYFAIAVSVFLMVKGVLGTAYEPMAQDIFKDMQGSSGEVQLAITYPLSVVTQSFLYFKYLFLWVVPVTQWMSVDMREPFATSLPTWPYWAAAIGFVGYIAAAIAMVLRGGRIGIAGWLLAMPWLLFATELSTVRVQEPFVLYRAYLWFPLLGALVPLALYRLNQKVVVALTIPVLCVLIGLSWNRLQTFSDTLILWEDAAKLLVTGKEPGAGRIYYNRALALAEKRRRSEALEDMDRVVALHPNIAPVYFARARIRFDLKQHEQALFDLDQAVKLKPDNSGYYTSRAMTLSRLGRTEEAIQDLRKSCDMKDIIGCYALAQQTKSENPQK